MARKRRNRSGGEVQKKVQKVEGNVNDKAKSPAKLETQTPRRTRRSAKPESPIQVIKQPKLGAHRINLSVSARKKVVARKNRDQVSETAQQQGSTSHPPDVDPLLICPESSSECRDNVKLRVPSLASFVDVKLEVDDEHEVSLCNDDKATYEATAMKMEVVDCGVHKWESDLEDPAQTSVPLLQSNVLDLSVITEVQGSLNAILPQDWFCKATDDGFNVMLLSRCKEKAIQRRLFFPFVGGMEVSVHRKPLLPQYVEELLESQVSSVPITVDSYQTFVEHVLKIVEKFWYMEVCGGADQCEFVDLWAHEKYGLIDENPYGEIRYQKTFRSIACKLLVQSHKWRCKECARLSAMLKRRSNKRKDIHQITKALAEKKGKGLVPKQDITVKKADDSGKVHILRNEDKLSLSVGADNSFTLKKGVPAKLSMCSATQSKFSKELEENQLLDLSSAKRQMTEHSVPPAPDHPVSFEKVAPKTYCFSSGAALPRSVGKQPSADDDSMYTASGKATAELEKSGVPVDDDLAHDLMTILKDINLSPAQRQLLEKQSELAANKKSLFMRWHPSLIRYALFVRSTFSEKFTSTGMITLPSGKNLFNFSQVLFRTKDFQKADLNDLLQKLYLRTCDVSKTYHVLLLDEIDISNNLVYQKSNGELIGYVKLSDIKSEMDQLEAYISVGKAITFSPKPYSFLVYIIKGLSFGMRELVGLLDASTVSKETVHDMTWNMIGNLEEKGIKVVAVVSSGSPKTKAFFDLHTPCVKLDSGHVFSTNNLKAKGRLIHFLLDASYLLKEIRNCFEESGSSSPKQKTLTRRDKPIVWGTIVKLFLASNKQSNLSRQNVFLEEYSRKRLSYALEVMSSTVAKDLASRGWDFTSETVGFITQVSDFFQCLLCSEVAEGDSSKNRIPPYTSLSDPRFTKLIAFLGFLCVWKLEVDSIPNLSNEERSKLLLDEVIFEDVEVTVRAFKDAASFLLTEGMKEINPNDFWLEPIGKFLEKGWFGFVQAVNSYT